MNLKDTYNKIAKDWYEDHKDDNWSRNEAKEFGKMFKKGSLILDAGCGPGIKSKDLSDQGVRVVGFDISESMVKLAKEIDPSSKFIVLDLKDVGSLKVEFDGIFAQACLLHIPKRKAFHVLQQLYLKLKKDGYIYLAVKENKKVYEEIKKEKDYGYEYERFFSYYTVDEIKKYFEQLNLKIIKCVNEKIGNTFWIRIIAQK